MLHPTTLRGLLVVVAVVATTVIGGELVAAREGASAQRMSGDPPDRRLADRYAPVAYLKRQRFPCDRRGEPYLPAPVEIVLGDTLVMLKEHDPRGPGPDRIILSAPRATDLPPRSEHDYLDFPGNARRPGCTYEVHARQRMSGLEPTTYARIIVDRERGQLALQYWLFYYFNDWNNPHEGDWEMIQLEFDAASVEEALHEDPVRVGYAQHAGGELAAWTDPKLQREGTRPIIYPAAGSHATHFESHVYIGWGENGTGFGCDDATGPSVRVPLRPVVVPNDPDPAGSFAWLHFSGRWGERQPWEYNGARGPQLNFKWREPFEAVESWRDSSLVVPRSTLFGRSATDFFCGTTDVGARVMAFGGMYPQVVVAGLIALWSAAFVLLLRVRRLLVEACALYRAHWRVFLPIGVLALPIGWGFNAIHLAAMRLGPVDWLLRWFNDTAGARFVVASIVGGFEQIVIVLVIGPIVIQAVAESYAGRTPDVRRCCMTAVRRIRPIATALVLIAAAVGGLALFVVTAPLALLLAVRWQFFGQAVIIGGARTGRAALRMSASVIRGRWLHLLAASIVVQGLAILPGPCIGAALMLMGKTTIQFANGLSSFVYAVLLPLAEIALTMLYVRYANDQILGRAAVPPAEPYA